MTRARTGYLVALVVAVVVLVGSVVGAAVWSSGSRSAGGHQQVTNSRGQALPGGPGVGGFGGRGPGPGMGPGTGRMRDGTGSGSAVSLPQARALAQSWVDEHLAGATLDSGFAMMRGYRFTVTSHGTVAAVLMVDGSDGAVSARLLAGSNPSATS